MTSSFTTPNVALIATLPKSGTWYSQIFFWCYDQLLANTQDYLDGKFTPDLTNELENKRLSGCAEYSHTLNIDRLHTTHTICPGFYELNTSHSAQWNELSFALDGYNHGEYHLRRSLSWGLLEPATNFNAKIIYLYRNPLDHFVSYYRHGKSHIDDTHRMKTLSDGTRTPIKDLHDFVFDFGGLASFIKHYYTFKQMNVQFPENVLLIPYESLTTDPENTFYNILTFLDNEPNTPIKLKLFKDALAMSAKDSIMSIESGMKTSLAGDQMSGERHIRNGEIGYWINHFSMDELNAIEAALNLFNISLNDFTLTNESNDTKSQFNFNQMPSHEKNQHQLNFLYQQLTSKDDKIKISASEIQKYKTQIESNKNAIHDYQNRVASLENQLNSIQSSRSWRATKPLRFVNKLIKDIL